MSQIDELTRLIASYRWLASEREAQLEAGLPGNADHVADVLDDVFARIVEFPASDARIVCRQIELLVAMLAEGPRDEAARRALSEAILAHVRRLAGPAGKAQTQAASGCSCGG